jgi:formiminotetrahydrofolate cyclodeaminase
MPPRWSVDELLAAIASPSPTGGGGAAVALTGAVAAALVELVASVAARRAPEASGLGEIVREAEMLRDRLVALIDSDVDAYGRVLEARRRTDEGRDAAVREALVGATEVPLEIAAAAVKILGHATAVVGEARPSTLADVRVAGVLAAAAFEGAALTARSNLEGVADRAYVERARGRLDELLRREAALRATLLPPSTPGPA